MNLTDQLHWLSDSLRFVVPELILVTGLLLLLVLGLTVKTQFMPLLLLSFLLYAFSLAAILLTWPENPTKLFLGMIRSDDYSSYFKILADTGAMMTILMTRRSQLGKPAEYFLLIVTVVLGAHLLVMSMNFIMVILSLELISLSSYALTGWSLTKQGGEGSLKYFLFGSVATAVTIYGMSLLFGLAGTLDFSSEKFVSNLIQVKSPLLVAGGMMTLSGFLFKMGAAPMHLWAPDVYESAPTPVVAFFSVVPKMAGLGVLVKFYLAISLFGQTSFDWQAVLATIAIISMTVGNFSALWQSNPKRLMAYSSIAHAGFLLVGAVAMSMNGLHAMLFYGTLLLIMNYLTFIMLQQYELDGASTIAGFAGLGRSGSLKSMAITIGLVSLVGFPVTAGFSAKLFIFSGLWDAYSQSHKAILIVLLIFGLINTVISLFYYLRIPYQLFLREPPAQKRPLGKIPFHENLLSLILVILILYLFFQPGLLMGWINRINFVL